MTAKQDSHSEFEQHAREVLEESVTRIDGRVRSRLTQARFAAIEEARRSRRPFWRGLTLFPVSGAVAAALMVAIVLWTGRADRSALPMADVPQATMEDIDLLADAEAFELVEEWDGAFYEWAVAQSESRDEASI
jgi:anti-sigma-K factor RskA